MARDGAAAAQPSRREARAGDGKPGYLGHRERLRERFLAGGTDAACRLRAARIPAVSRALPRRDVKPLAKALIARFGGFAGVLGAGRDALAERRRAWATPPSPSSSGARRRQAARCAARCRKRPRHRRRGGGARLLPQRARPSPRREQFRVLFLDRKNALIADELQQRGTVDHTPVYPREVVKRALELSAPPPSSWCTTIPLDLFRSRSITLLPIESLEFSGLS